MVLSLSPPSGTCRDWRLETGLTQAAASVLVGGISSPGKIPCHSYGLPAAQCHTGSRARAASTPEAPNVCGGCYALKGKYVFPCVQNAQYRRLAIVLDALVDPDARELWLRAMVCLIGWASRESRVFRFHDSGDIQCLDHLSLIAELCERLPWVEFWIPTRESRMVRDWTAANGPLPANLAVRESLMLVGQFPRVERDDGRLFSAVARHGQEIPEGMHACPAYKQDGKCGSCRACWNSSTTAVVYPLH